MTFFFFFFVLVLLGHALKLSTRLWDDMEPAVVMLLFLCCIFLFDIIIVRWLLADSCVYLIFFCVLKNSFLRAQCLMADSAGDKAHLSTVTAHTLHARYSMRKKRARVCEM